VSTVAKTLKLLQYLKTTSPELGLTQFTRLSGYDKASTHRRLTDLLNAGFLEQDPITKTYRLGAAISRLALVREQSFPAGESAQRILHRLYELVQETVHVSVIQGTDGLSTLAHVDDQLHGNRVYIEPADLLPFHATASGIVVLAYSDQAFRDEVLGRDFDRITEDTETDPEILRLQIEGARRSGFGRSEGAYEADVFSLSAPLFGRERHCAGAIAVALPKARLTQEAEVEIMQSLAASAEELTEAWAGTTPPELKSAWAKTLA
jgi:IclR family acetate operon transcriptional repressor